MREGSRCVCSSVAAKSSGEMVNKDRRNPTKSNKKLVIVAVKQIFGQVTEDWQFREDLIDFR